MGILQGLWIYPTTVIGWEMFTRGSHGEGGALTHSLEKFKQQGAEVVKDMVVLSSVL